MHFFVGILHHLGSFCRIVGSLLLHILAEAAEVVFEIVEAPVRIGLGVLRFVTQAACVLGTSLRTGPGVDANLEALGVNVVGQRLHVGEFAIGVDVALSITLTLPGVVNVHVDVPGVFHAGGHHGIGGGADIRIVHLAGKEVPAVPAHGRRRRQCGALCE